MKILLRIEFHLHGKTCFLKCCLATHDETTFWIVNGRSDGRAPPPVSSTEAVSWNREVHVATILHLKRRFSSNFISEQNEDGYFFGWCSSSQLHTFYFYIQKCWVIYLYFVFDQVEKCYTSRRLTKIACKSPVFHLAPSSSWSLISPGPVHLIHLTW